LIKNKIKIKNFDNNFTFNQLQIFTFSNRFIYYEKIKYKIMTETKIKFTLLGTGTSTGVPTIGCKCETCQSSDQRDKRLRCSLLIQTKDTTVVIDTTPDFRQQMLTYNVDQLDAVIFTHSHYDHICGFDDIRAFNFTLNKSIDIFANEVTFIRLKNIFDYAFIEPEQLGGGVPLINQKIIENNPFYINDIEFIPILMYHGKMEVLGFRIGNFAYCTDTNNIPLYSMNKLRNLDILILDGLRYTPHPTHFSLSESLEIIEQLNPQKAFITHISHQIKHSECEIFLPENVYLGFDGLEIEM
jgi:phosphoribosyl 1,2-cyclic phosphate phosphodiesterase